jgi:peptidoglycan hydrolase-like protein with peptidoglycan-binding domain
MRTLTLTTPLTRGPAVDRAQRILTNRGYFVGKIDGVFGEITGRACSDAKYALGYAAKNIKPSYGNDLEAFLTGKKPTLAMRIRQSQRKKKTSLGEAALKVGGEYIGVKENPPGSNKVMFSDWYGIVGPWCAMFVTYCMVKANSKTFSKGQRYAYCPYILTDARLGKGMTIVHEDAALPGDIVLYSWKRDGVPEHVGIVMTPPHGGISFIALEGNTSGSDNSNGGEVMARQRHIDDVVAFVRVVR